MAVVMLMATVATTTANLIISCWERSCIGRKQGCCTKYGLFRCCSGNIIPDDTTTDRVKFQYHNVVSINFLYMFVLIFQKLICEIRTSGIGTAAICDECLFDSLFKKKGTGAARDVCHQTTTVEINQKTEQHFFCTTRFIFLKNQIDFVPRTYFLRPEYRSVCFWFHCRCVTPPPHV
jgi:hypothetical protein